MNSEHHTVSSRQHWFSAISKLRVDRKGGIAPHKPLLLLTVIELVEEGLLREPLFELTGDLAFRFLTLWPVVAARRSQSPNIRMPFFHLGSDTVWTPLTATKDKATDKSQAQYAMIDDDFFSCLSDAEFRHRARQILITTFFESVDERVALFGLTNTEPEGAYEFREAALQYKESTRISREARFRLTVVPAWNYTCALTGYRLITIEAGSMVDAAHIHQFADSRNNDPRNGIALSKNAHWAFDQGLWSLTDDYRIVTAKVGFCETGDPHLLLANYDGRRIHLPSDHRHWPDPKNLAWHRREKLKIIN